MGSFDCESLSDGIHVYKLEQMFGNATRTDVEAALQAHGLSTDAVHTPYTYLYVNTGKHQILVDAGAGNLFPTTGKLLQNIETAFGDLRDPASIDADCQGVDAVIATANVNATEGPSSFEAVQGKGYKDFISISKKHHVKQFIYCAVPVTMLADQSAVDLQKGPGRFSFVEDDAAQ